MQGIFLRHLDNVADQTAAIIACVNLLLNIVHQQTGSIWDIEHQFADPDPDQECIANNSWLIERKALGDWLNKKIRGIQQNFISLARLRVNSSFRPASL
jgi:hypothetical protein